ncbi:3-dehydroquinate synthase (DHQS), partial [Durusdinium trenchii]
IFFPLIVVGTLFVAMQTSSVQGGHWHHRHHGYYSTSYYRGWYGGYPSYSYSGFYAPYRLHHHYHHYYRHYRRAAWAPSWSSYGFMPYGYAYATYRPYVYTAPSYVGYAAYIPSYSYAAPAYSYTPGSTVVVARPRPVYVTATYGTYGYACDPCCGFFSFTVFHRGARHALNALRHRLRRLPDDDVAGRGVAPGLIPGNEDVHLVLQSSTRDVVAVDLGPRSYEIIIERGILASAAGSISEWVDRAYPGQSPRCAHLITDENVRSIAQTVATSLTESGWQTSESVIPPGEPSKNLEVATQILENLAERHADRRTVVIAVGGGVVGDLAGFVAATYVPTTGKTSSVPFISRWGVLIDPETLTSLPVREYRAGLAEVVKYGVILDAEFFEALEEHRARINDRDPGILTHAIGRSCRLKADVVEQDEYEQTGLRAVLNYGHTFAHAFEALAGYGELLHGEAVSMGMICASELAARLGRIPAELTERQRSLLSDLGLPVDVPALEKMTVPNVIERMRRDKKSVAGKLRFVLPTRLGHVELVDDVPESMVEGVLADAGLPPA